MSESPTSGGLTRRAVLGSGGALATGTVLGVGASPLRASAAKSKLKAYVVLLGTAGGPPPHADRCGIASALVVDGKTYLVDAGRGMVTQYLRGGLKLADLAAVFVTHLHGDHVADYYNLFLLGGNPPPTLMDSLPDTTPVFGPGPAGGLPPTFGGGSSPTVNPADPTPGLRSLTTYCNDAYAYSTNVFMRDSRIRDTSTLMDVHEITIPAVGASYQNTAPAMAPFVVMEDDRVRVSATLVVHGPVFPAFAYRFDTDHGSVTFSGDTAASDNLIRLARRSDLLIHEAINVQGFAGSPALVEHLLTSHVEVQKVGAIAARADVPRLALSHIGDMASPTINVRAWARWARQGYSGRVHIGADLDVLKL